MKNLIWILVLFALAIGLALAAGRYSGNVFLVLESDMLRINLHLFIIGLLASVFLLYVLFRIIGGVLGMPGLLSRAGSRRSSRKADAALNAAGLAYFEGKYQQAVQQAEKVLANKEAGDKRVLAVMLAAHAADAMGDAQTREKYLQDIAKLPEKMQLSRYLLLAESALNEQNTEAAEQQLKAAAQINPRLTRLVRLQLRLAQEQGNALEILDKADKLRRAGAVGGGELKQYTHEAYRDLLAMANDGAGMKACLKRIPDELKNGGLCAPIAQRYADLGMYAQAVAWVKQHYPHSRNAALLPVFIRSVAYLGEREQRKAIDTADAWLGGHDQDAQLLHYLGELAYQHKLWGKARAYLEAALAVKSSVPARLTLAKVLDEAGEGAQAQAQRDKALAEIPDAADEAA